MLIGSFLLFSNCYWEIIRIFARQNTSIMITKDTLLQIIYEQKEYKLHNVIARKIDSKLLNCAEVLVITGVRRCGKSVLLRQIQTSRSERDYYINFDDERLLSFTVEDFQKLDELFHEEFGEQHTYYFDEIQNIDGWERFVSRLYSSGNKVFVTGSNAHLLSKEMGTLLTGRHVTHELYPFSFAEYLEFLGVDFSRKDFFTTKGKALLSSSFQDYLVKGGFPQYLNNGSENYLKSIYSDIVFRDVIVRNRISSERQLREMLFYLASNATNLCTYNSIAKNIGMSSSDTIASWIDNIEQTYLISQLCKYSPKVGVQLRSPKKIYFIDNALASQIGFNMSKNIGRWLENVVAVELLRRGGNVFYYNDGAECDFVVREGNTVKQVIQVTASMESEPTRSRELKGLQTAMDAFGLNSGIILTLTESETISLPDGKEIIIMPCWRWML